MAASARCVGAPPRAPSTECRRRRSSGARSSRQQNAGDVVIGIDHTWATDLKHGRPARHDPLRRGPSRPADCRTARRSQARGPGELGMAQASSRRSRRRARRRHPDSGSASNGHPRRPARSSRSAAGSTPWRPPTMITPALASNSAAQGPLTAMPRGTGSGGPIGSGTSPTSPSSGSRNGRLRCTGPARRWPRTRAGRAAATTSDRTRRARVRRGTNAPSARTARSGRSSAGRRRRAAPVVDRR